MLPSFVLENVSVWFVFLLVFSILLSILTVILLVKARGVAGFLAEKSLQDVLSSRELFYALYRNSPVPYVLLLKHGEISLLNDAAIRLFGLKEEELRGKVLFDFLTADNEKDQAHVEVLPSRFRQEAPIYNEECALRCPNGALRYVLLSLFPVKTSGNPHRGLAALVDITKQKEVDKAKTEFVSLASHQLRSPLAALRWNIELLASPKAGDLTETQQNYLAILESGIDRMGALIDDFLSMSRLELGMLTASKTRITLQDFVSDILHDLETPIAAKELQVTSDIDAPFVISDTRLLRHIVGNLLSNAVKYTPEGGSARLRAYESEGAIVFEVSDTGMGIPEEEQGKLFEKFFRASNAQKSVAEGTGLGLYIVKLAVEALGGSISFASRGGLGTAFTVRLPQ